MKRHRLVIALALSMLTAGVVSGVRAQMNLDYAQVLEVVAEKTGGKWTFSVTVRHDDEGWEHYADQWQVVDPSTGEVIAARVLAHPHVNEQPFTRSLSNVTIPPGTTEVLVRAKCNRHGFEGRTVRVDLTKEEGPGFTVK